MAAKSSIARKVGVSPVIAEPLEQRRLLAAAGRAVIVNGILQVKGTNGNDQISIEIKNGNMIEVKINGKATDVSTTGVTGIDVHALDGADEVHPLGIVNQNMT